MVLTRQRQDKGVDEFSKNEEKLGEDVMGKLCETVRYQ